MSAKKPAQISQMFANVSQNQEVLQLRDRVDELEVELLKLRSQPLAHSEKETLEKQIQELAQQLAQQGGEHHIPLEQIHPDPEQPRTVFAQAIIQSRAKSLREEGQHSPIILIPQSDNTYKLFDGELRWRSAPLAEMNALRAVFLTQEALLKVDRAAIFDRQLTTSLQSEKLHPFDLANGLVKLMVMRYPELNQQVDAIPSLLNATIQRLRRTGEIEELESIALQDKTKQKQWIEKACNSKPEGWILEIILSKQLNPVSINSNVFPLLNLPEDLKSAIRTEGLEGSKILELKKISGKSLNIEESLATDIRVELTNDVIQQRLALDKIRAKVKQILHFNKQSSQASKQLELTQRLVNIPKQLKQAKVWLDPQKRKKLEKLLNDLEGLLS